MWTTFLVALKANFLEFRVSLCFQGFAVSV